MTREDLRGVLGWCAVINIGFLMVWFFGFLLAHDVVYQIHRSMFPGLSPERFDELHYQLIGFYKLSVILLNFVPYIALRIIPERPS
jgi:hypothetical protein